MNATIHYLAAERARRERQRRHEEAIIEMMEDRSRKHMAERRIHHLRLMLTALKDHRWFEDERHG